MFEILNRNLAWMTTSALALLTACHSGGGDAAPGRGSGVDDPDVGQLEQELIATQSNLGERVAEARACFESFGECLQATPGDAPACGEDLKACLPELGGPDFDVPNFDFGALRGFQPPDLDENGLLPGVECELKLPRFAPSRRDTGRGRRGAGFGRSFGFGRHGFGGFGEADAGRDVDDAEPDGGAGLPRCEIPGLPDFERPELPERLVECAGDVDASAGMDPATLAEAFEACIGASFRDRVDHLCERAAEACAADRAPGAICERLADACESP